MLGWDGTLSFSRRIDWFSHAFLEDAFRDLGGKTWFLSPEELSGAAPGIPTSTWHAAALTYRLLTSHGPFRDESDFETMHNIIEIGRPPLAAPWLTGSVSRWFNQAFDRDVGARPTPTQLRRELSGRTMDADELGRFFSSAFADEFQRQQEMLEQAGLGEVMVGDDVTEVF